MRQLSDDHFLRVEAKLIAFETNPRPIGCLKLADFDNVYRVRIGDLRILYSIDDKAKIVTVNKVAHRSEAY